MNEAEIKELKKAVSDKTGVPADLIAGETAAEIEASAHTLATYKRECWKAAPTRDKFAAYLNGDVPAAVVPDPAPINNNVYPIVPDGGEPQNISHGPKDPRDAFTEWFNDVSAFNPYKNTDIF